MLLLSLVLIFHLLGCNGDNPVESNKPVLESLIAPDSLIKNLPDVYLFKLAVSDPQGLDNIDSVYYTVNKPDGTTNGAVYYLYDDGETGGDEEAGDGVYTSGFSSPTSSNQSGDYVFHFTARDLDRNLSETLDWIITAYEYDNPVISHIVANQYDPERRYLYVSARVVDAQGQGNIERVWADITYVDEDTLIGSYDLNDFGNDGDSTVADYFYSLNIAATLDTIYEAGNYLIEFNAQDWTGNQAAPAETTIVISPPI